MRNGHITMVARALASRGVVSVVAPPVSAAWAASAAQLTGGLAKGKTADAAAAVAADTTTATALPTVALVAKSTGTGEDSKEEDADGHERFLEDGSSKGTTTSADGGKHTTSNEETPPPPPLLDASPPPPPPPASSPPPLSPSTTSRTTTATTATRSRATSQSSSSSSSSPQAAGAKSPKGRSLKSVMSLPVDHSWRGELVIDGFDDLWQRWLPSISGEWLDAVRGLQKFKRKFKKKLKKTADIALPSLFLFFCFLLRVYCPNSFSTGFSCCSFHPSLPCAVFFFFFLFEQAAFSKLRTSHQIAALRKGPLSAFALFPSSSSSFDLSSETGRETDAKPASIGSSLATTSFELLGEFDAVSE
jgi:hypothetical protein